jgi:isopenicillin N synthase-like dioxygenase
MTKAFYGSDAKAKANLVTQVKNCCLYNGFFQIVGHRVPSKLQSDVFDCSKQFFEQPLEEKKKVSKGNSVFSSPSTTLHHSTLSLLGLLKTNSDLNTWNRGYELLRSQMLEPGTSPELKEGYYIGEDLPTTHPYFLQRKLNSGPNFWPTTLPNISKFKTTTMEYYMHVCALARDVLKVLALTLDLDEGYFDAFADGAVATMRLLHYPPQEKSDGGDKGLSRGIGAHTDFGAVTLLLQGEVGGLQVWEKETETWLDVRELLVCLTTRSNVRAALTDLDRII